MSRHGENIRRREDGRWEARYVYTATPARKKITKSFYGSTYLEAKQKRNTFIEGINQKIPALSVAHICPTVRDVAISWLNSKQPDIKESTAARYSNILTLYILPELGDLTIDCLDSDCINKFLTGLLQHGSVSHAKGLSAKTVADVKAILMAILKYALMLKIIHSLPECRKISCAQANVEVLTKAEQAVLENILFNQDDPIYLACILSLYTGVRVGEVCGLQWKDIDFTNGTVSVTKTVLRITNTDETLPCKTKVIVQSPKSHSSFRIIPIPEAIQAYLLCHKADGDIYLASGTPSYIEPRKCQYRFKKVLKQAGIKSYKFHVLRHTFATRCIESGVDVKSLSEIMGHSSVTITLQRYVHPSMEMKQVQLNKLKKISISDQEQELRN